MSSEPPAAPNRRERPAKPALTRAGIVAAAVAILRDEGLDHVTMRRLATELDTGAASLYVYVRNAAELRAAVLDDLLAGVDLSVVAADGDWRERLSALLDSYLRVLLAHPALARSALSTRPCGPRYLDLAEAVLTLLHQGGIEDRRAVWAVDLLLRVATATGAEQATRQENPGDDARAGTVEEVDPHRYPPVHPIGADLPPHPDPVRVEWGFSVLLNGIAATPPP